ncbi:MAG: hypothetical protein KGI28_03555 [Thaumarchaeota archaeon]|nr:hypothetical protein [Nitrososphaerota archaeon]
MSIISNEHKIVIVLAIEHTLLQMDKSILEKVQTKLRKEYNSSLSDCYTHPEYLVKVLKSLFGKSYPKIVKSVSDYLKDFSYQKPIVEFLDKIN